MTWATTDSFRDSGYLMDNYPNGPQRRGSDYLFKKVNGASEQVDIPVLGRKTSDYEIDSVVTALAMGSGSVNAKRSEFQLADLRKAAPIRIPSTYSYYDPKEERNLDPTDKGIVRANVITRKELLKRIKNLKEGLFIPTIINGQLYFVRSSDDEMKTASESPSLTNIHDEGSAKAAVSDEALRMAENMSHLSHDVLSALCGDTPTSGVETAKSFATDVLTAREASFPASTAKSLHSEGMLDTAIEARDPALDSQGDDLKTAREASFLATGLEASSPARAARSKKATSPARQPLSDMRTPNATFVATGLEASSPARQPLSDMRTPNSSFVATGLEASSPARPPLSDMRTPKASSSARNVISVCSHNQGLITGKEASSSARQPLSDMRTPKSSPSHTVMSFRSQDVVTTKESTSPVHQPLSDMRTPKASSPAHTATNLRSQGLDTGKEATSPARQPLSDMRTGPEASFMATGLEATSPARQPLSYMRTPKGSPTHSLHSQGLVTGKEACSPARQPLSDMRTPPRKPTEATSPTVKSSRSDLLQTGIEASSPARTARGFRSQEVIVLAGNEPTTGVFTAVSPLHAARSCEALATAKELVEIAKGEDNETTAVEMTSPVHTALSIISEATATDRDFTVSSGYDAFSDHDEPTLDVDTAREINSGIDRQAILRTMGYTVPSQLDTNVLQPRENASSTEVAAAGLAKTPDDFDAKISAYSLVAPDQFEDLKPRDNASSTEVAAAGLAKTPEAFDAKVSSYVQSLGKQPSEFSLESACPSQESSQFDI